MTLLTSPSSSVSPFTTANPYCFAVVADAFYLNQFAVHFIQNEANGQVIADDAIQFAVFTSSQASCMES